MRIGYPCLNRSIGCTPSKTFRLASYTEERLEQTIAANLACLQKILEYNVEHGLLFLRITSDLVPFASHEICTYSWQEQFADIFQGLGDYCKKHGFRISMHPDQFVLLNAPDAGVLERSIRELAYQSAVLDLMGLDRTAKIQIHVGGVYGDKAASMDRFVENYSQLDKTIRARLVIENDERLYAVADCRKIHDRTGIPVILDTFHHSLNNQGEPVQTALSILAETWTSQEGLPMVDYSSQQEGKRPGAHAEHIVSEDFSRFLGDSKPCDFDLMLEIKDKEKSANLALALAAEDFRLVTRSA
ncbi:MAG: UV DNA damage repair endonuclease UvsE [Methanomicrobiales archaeon HGW-Methanomicrobiales-3]|jgi:UV DNA damage endonuclease|nr:MAG: UV DNA damage repair endonuclease UvsE [Methanomicrobiales archaeon HGW-Methanomicrobiales-3]